MKICIIANGYPTKREPQWGCFERDQALALSKLGHEVSILYFDRRFRKYWRKIGLTKKQEQGLSIYGLFYLPLAWLRDRVSYKLNQKIVTRGIDRLLGTYVKDYGKPDVIYAHYIWNIFYAAILKDKYNVPLVGIEHWSGLTNEVLSPRSSVLGNIAYSKVDRLLAVSQSLQSHIKKHFNKDSIVVHDMLGQEFVSASIQRQEHDKEFTFIAVGSLIYRKGYDLLLRAFAMSNLAEKGSKLVIIGEGPEKSNLEKQIEELGVSEYVSLVGRKTKDEIISFMSNCQVFVLSSRAETFGVVCIEALSQGLPNIATICGGPEEFINDDNGILIPSDDVNAMANAMVMMYENYRQYDRDKIANDCLKHFSPEIIARQLTDIFESVIK